MGQRGVEHRARTYLTSWPKWGTLTHKVAPVSANKAVACVGQQVSTLLRHNPHRHADHPIKSGLELVSSRPVQHCSCSAPAWVDNNKTLTAAAASQLAGTAPSAHRLNWPLRNANTRVPLRHVASMLLTHNI